MRLRSVPIINNAVNETKVFTCLITQPHGSGSEYGIMDLDHMASFYKNCFSTACVS